MDVDKLLNSPFISRVWGGIHGIGIRYRVLYVHTTGTRSDTHPLLTRCIRENAGGATTGKSTPPRHHRADDIEPSSRSECGPNVLIPLLLSRPQSSFLWTPVETDAPPKFGSGSPLVVVRIPSYTGMEPQA